MLARVQSGAMLGMDAYIIEVEVGLAPGLPAFTTVGLPETTVKESQYRVKAAEKNSGYQFPMHSHCPGVGPPGVPGLLSAIRQISLDGRLKLTRGVLSYEYPGNKQLATVAALFKRTYFSIFFIKGT